MINFLVFAENPCSSAVLISAKKNQLGFDDQCTIELNDVDFALLIRLIRGFVIGFV